MLRLSLILVSAAAVLSGCNGPEAAPARNNTAAIDGSAEQGGMPGMNMMMPAPGDSEATREFKQAMMASMQNMPPFTGDADRDFMQQMKVHHQAAIQMSETLLRHGKDQQTRALAQEIVKAQQREIGEIDAWLARGR